MEMININGFSHEVVQLNKKQTLMSKIKGWFRKSSHDKKRI